MKEVLALMAVALTRGLTPAPPYGQQAADMNTNEAR